MITIEEVETLLESAFPGDDIVVDDMTGTSDHFAVQVVSARFEGVSRLEQHRMIHEVFKDHMQGAGGDVHALKIKTKTP